MTPTIVVFEHLRYEFSDELLVRYGSPYFDERTAGIDLVKQFQSAVINVSAHTDAFDPRQLLSANEAFPEAALADPLADLEVWDDWQTGLRAFPYPGTYSKLGITQQESKTAASSSVGVLGEIMAGLYAQAGIAPWVLVRVIRHWPDFIFSLRGNRYAFVEAKAFTGNSRYAVAGIPQKLLGECLVAAVQQLNADPFVQVWGAFTHVQQISPLSLKVIFLEIDASDARRRALVTRILPDVVVDGIAERALNTSLHRVEPEYIGVFSDEGKLASRFERKRLEVALIEAAMQELESMLIDQELKVIMLQSRQDIERRVAKLVRKVRPSVNLKARRLFGVLGDTKQLGLARVRSIGTGDIFAGRLDARDYGAVGASWQRDWKSACNAWGYIDDTPVWRCGGALFAVADKDLTGHEAHAAT